MLGDFLWQRRPPQPLPVPQPVPDWERLADEILAAAGAAPGQRNRWCRPCDVKWFGAAECWSCGQPA